MEETKQLIADSKNIYVIPSESHEAIASALALFYTLRHQGKNVNLLLDHIPESLTFLSPSLDFVSQPKNFVISIPNSQANVSQIYYEKSAEAVKIHLTLEKGAIRKEDLSFYFSEPKPDAIITIGIQDYAHELEGKLNSFGFLLDSPMVNIDNQQNNQKFGKINLVEEKSLAEIIASIIEASTKPSATALLSAVVIGTDNFKKNLTAELFSLASSLMKQGADLKEITNHIYSPPINEIHVN